MRAFSFSLFGAALVALPCAALEPVAGPANYSAVCQHLGRVAAKAETMLAAAQAGSDSYEPLKDFTDALVSLGFSAETRATVDADDLDILLTDAEYVALLPAGVAGGDQAEALWTHLQQFARRYRCKMTRVN